MIDLQQATIPKVDSLLEIAREKFAQEFGKEVRNFITSFISSFIGLSTNRKVSLLLLPQDEWISSENILTTTEALFCPWHCPLGHLYWGEKLTEMEESVGLSQRGKLSYLTRQTKNFLEVHYTFIPFERKFKPLDNAKVIKILLLDWKCLKP